MRELLLLLALAIQPGRAAEPPTVARVALYVQFDQTPPAAVMNSLRTELDSIMAPAGLQFEWRALADSSAEVTAELAVVSFKGRCDSTSLPPHSTNPGALGWTHISDGVILPFTDLDCGGLRAFLGEQLLALARGDRDAALGRALGRVLAHELYHIFANTTRHAPDGIGKPAYSVEDLLSADFRFAKREALAMRSH
ncbi:MAG: hypothetical protein ABSB88_25480 [Bryobacteraceae bacterium]|jgi:hypothetical protein